MTAERLLHALADGRPQSGEDLARALGVTRAAIAVHVGKLTHWGLAVETSPGDLYRLPRNLELVDAARLRAALDSGVQSRLAKLEVFTELDSTNRYLLAAPPPEGRLDVCLAEFQTAGRGRRGRRWVAPLGSGICVSVGSQLPGMPAESAALTLAVGVAVRRALQRAAGVTVALKWPNDLVIDDRKLGGILLERKPMAHGVAHVVVGVGVNVALPSALLPSLSDWPRGAIDLTTALAGRAPPRTVLAGALINELAALLANFPARGFEAYRGEWRAADVLRGRAVRLDEAAGPVMAKALGIDADGALLVETEAGERRRIVAGDVSVRGHP